MISSNLSNKNGLVILDRDGTIIRSVVRPHTKLGSARNVNEIVENYDMYNQIKLWSSKKLGICVVSNQPELSNGDLSLHQLESIDNFLITQTNIDLILYCPHLAKMKCRCRKPENLMLEVAIDLFSINRDKTLFIGDRSTDIEAAIRSEILPVHFINEEQDCEAPLKHIDVFNTLELTKLVLGKMIQH